MPTQDQQGNLHATDGKFTEKGLGQPTDTTLTAGPSDPVDAELVEALSDTIAAINEDIMSRSRSIVRITNGSLGAPDHIPADRIMEISADMHRKQSMANVYREFNHRVIDKGMNRHRALAEVMSAAHDLPREGGNGGNAIWRDGALSATVGISRFMDAIERDNGVNL